MKNILTFFYLLSTVVIFAQAPQKFNYQAVARNAQGAVLANQSIKIRASILDASANGISQYSETHSITSNSLGLFTLAIGGGNAVSGKFTDITWSSGDKYLKIEMDATGGNNYALMGTSQLLSVPYALNAGNGSQWNDVVNGIKYENNVVVGDSPNPAGTNGIVQIYAETESEGAIAIERGELRMSSETELSIDAPNQVGGRFVVDKKGNVGIGLDTPTGKLHLLVNSTSDQGLRISDGVNSNINIQPVESGGQAGPSGFQAINFNGYYNNSGGNSGIGGESLYNFNKTRWRIGADQRFNSFDHFFIDIFNPNNPSKEKGVPFVIGPNGFIGLGTQGFSISNPEYPKSRLQVENGDIFITEISKGVIMKSPNGQCWRMTVSNAGQPVFSSITCP